MKKLFLLALSVLMCTGLWAETAVLATSTMDGQNSDYEGPAGTSTTANNVMVGKADGIGTGWVLQCNTLNKGCNGSQTMTIDETNYTSLKNSNGAKHTVKLPDGYVATSVTFYAVSNYTYNETYKTAKLSEFNGVTCADEVADKGQTPTAITKALGYETSFTFTFNVTQVNYLVVVTYQEALPEYTFGIGRTVETAYTETEGNILAVGQEQLKGEAPTGVVVTQTTTCDYANTNATLYHGATDNANKYTAANAWRNYLSAGSVGAINGAYNDGFYAGFSVTIPSGKVMNVIQIYGDMIAQKNKTNFKFVVVKDGETIYTSADRGEVDATTGGTANMPMMVNTALVLALQNLEGTVEFRMPWYIGSSAASGAVLDFNINTTFANKQVGPDEPQEYGSFTFGTTRDATDGQVTSNNYMIDAACPYVSSGSLLNTYNTLGIGYKFYDGTSTQLTFGANATQSYRNSTNSATIKTQAGDADGAENHDAYIGFDLTVNAGQQIQITEMASHVYPGEKSNYGYEYIVEDSEGNQLYKSAAFNVANPQAGPTDHQEDVSSVNALKGLTGTIRVKFLWWCNSSSTVLILKDFNVTASVSDVSEDPDPEPEPDPESTWRDIKMDFTTESSFIRTVTTEAWTNINTGIAVAEDGTVSAVEPTAENSVGTLGAKYVNAQWGLSAPTFTVAVEGPVKISLGSSYYDGTVTIEKNGETLTSFKSYVGAVQTKLWSRSNPDCVSYLYMGEAATLTISSNQYCPYIAVEKFVTVSEDFKIDFRTDPYTVVLPATGVLPAGVTVEATRYHGAQHGTINGKMHVNVAGPTKFTIGGCQFNNSNAVIKDASGNTLATLDTKAAGCDNGFGTYSHFATYYYTGETQELVIDLGSYCPYIFVEKVAAISDQMTEEVMTALNGFNGDVTVNRSLTAGMFNTICLPFDMSADEITAAFGASCDIRELSTATLDDNELVLNFTDATTIEAGKAYLIKPAADVTTWTMENVTLSKNTNPSITASVDFIGVLTPTVLTASENTLCVGAGNTLFYVDATSTMKGLRAYFQVKGAAVGAPARISLGGQVATGVENVNDNANVSKLIEQGRVIIRIDGHDYDLNGRLLK